MREQRETLAVESGHHLQQYTWRPESGDIRGGLIMAHGQGDHLCRYAHVARRMVERGFVCTGMDLPGHGLSSGIRGDIPSLDLVMSLMDRSLAHLRSELPDDAPVGIFCHSMAGFAGLHYLPKRAGIFRFAWISSPLVNPAHRQPPWLVGLSKIAVKVVPRLTVDTGVRSRMLHHEDCEGGPAFLDPLMHHRISVRYGVDLMEHGEALRDTVRGWKDPGLRLLVTQGTEDDICPPQFSWEIYEMTPLAGKRWISIEDSLHEPLHDHKSAWLMDEVDAWLDEIGVGVKEAPVP